MSRLDPPYLYFYVITKTYKAGIVSTSTKRHTQNFSLSNLITIMSSKLSQKDFSYKFLPYLPQDAGYNVATHLKSNLIKSKVTQLNDDEIQRVELLEIINDDLSNLLKMQFEDFVKSVMRQDIQKYLCTFLQFSRRSTDNLFTFDIDDEKSKINSGGEGKIDMFGIDELSQSIRRKTFLIIYRLTDSKQISLKFTDENKYGKLLYDQWIFDIPRLLDFCSIYHFSNPSITKQIISYIFKIQPKYNDDLKHAIDLVKYFYILLIVILAL